jgi:hypothetical protein
MSGILVFVVDFQADCSVGPDIVAAPAWHIKSYLLTQDKPPSLRPVDPQYGTTSARSGWQLHFLLAADPHQHDNKVIHQTQTLPANSLNVGESYNLHSRPIVYRDPHCELHILRDGLVGVQWVVKEGHHHHSHKLWHMSIVWWWF